MDLECRNRPEIISKDEVMVSRKRIDMDHMTIEGVVKGSTKMVFL